MPNGETETYYEGMQVYNSAARRGFVERILAWVRGRPAHLISYDDFRDRLRLREGMYLGLQDVCLTKIIGSVGRYNDFTASFLPKDVISRERWSRVYAEINGETGLPPVELFRVFDGNHEVYFVRDGNHRVSVARMMKFNTIQAYVTDVRTKICLEYLFNTNDFDGTEAYATFLDASDLRYQQPEHEYLFLSHPCCYENLLDHIHYHAANTGETVAQWHDHVYKPIIDLVREYHILQNFPQRTEADFFLWLVENLEALEICYLDETRKLNHALLDLLTDHNLTRLMVR